MREGVCGFHVLHPCATVGCMTTRKSIPLSEFDLDFLSQVSSGMNFTSKALRDLTGVDPLKESEASLLNLVFGLGAAQVQNQAMSRQYENWAASMTEEDILYRQVLRSRRRGGGSDE